MPCFQSLYQELERVFSTLEVKLMHLYGHIFMVPLAKLFLNFSSDLLPEHKEKPQACTRGAVRLGYFTCLGDQSQGLAHVSSAEKTSGQC